MVADTGPIGGDMSHEFIILADTGESEVFCHKDWLEMDVLQHEIDYRADLSGVVDAFTSKYAATDEMHDPASCPIAEEDMITTRGIEVGHIFYFGTKYSGALNASVTASDGSENHVHMGSYGIGVSRLVGGIIEASHDDNGIWPESVAPFKVGLVNIRVGEACDAAAQSLYESLETRVSRCSSTTGMSEPARNWRTWT